MPLLIQRPNHKHKTLIPLQLHQLVRTWSMGLLYHLQPWRNIDLSSPSGSVSILENRGSDWPKLWEAPCDLLLLRNGLWRATWLNKGKWSVATWAYRLRRTRNIKSVSLSESVYCSRLPICSFTEKQCVVFFGDANAGIPNHYSQRHSPKTSDNELAF